jgi:glycosyltransferase involved in cell wall biosynthesis
MSDVSNQIAPAINTNKQRIGLISSAVPLVFGGGRFIVDWLEAHLRNEGHEVESILIPTVDNPNTILEQMTAFRLIELDRHFDTVITFRPPSHLVRHRRKVCWFIHHIRIFYDLWNTDYNHLPDTTQTRALRDTIHRFDTAALSEAHKLFTNSRIVADRVKAFNGLHSEILYPPVLDASLFRADSYRDEIVCVCRMERHKRQHLLIEAMRYVATPIRLRLCGLSSSSVYYNEMCAIVEEHSLQDKVIIEHRWISEQEKADRLATCLAAAYVPFDEDSYGYPTLEAAHASKCTVTVQDSGGVREFVENEHNGYVVPADPRAIAEAFDALYVSPARSGRLGRAARETVSTLGIDWPAVIRRILS